MMKIFVFFIFLLICYVEVKGNKFECDVQVTCTENDTSNWETLIKAYDLLINMPNLNTSVAENLRREHKFCTDDRLGFLPLNNLNFNWSIACIWTNDFKGGCFPTPNSSYPYDYFPRLEWDALLYNLRKDVGCPAIALQNALQVQELHICRERCIDCGFSTGSWLLLDAAIFSLLIAIGL